MKIPPWSFSSVTSFETCPRRHYLTKVAKLVTEPPTEHTIWGNKVHKAIEDRIKSKAPLPEGMTQWEPIVAPFDNPRGQVFTETQFALTMNLQPCKWNDPACWVRGIVDAGVDAGETAALLDWKTGKPKPDSDQMRLFSALFMQTRPYVVTTTTAFVWLAHDKVTQEVCTRDDLPGIWEGFIIRSEKLRAAYENNKWPPKPSGLCRGWCPVPYGQFSCGGCEFSQKS